MEATPEFPIPNIVLDIETYPDVSEEHLEQIRANLKAPSGYKDPVKIKAYIEKEKVKALSKAGLSPRTGRAVCVGIGVRTHDGGKPPRPQWDFAAFVDKENDEEKLLTTIDEVLNEQIHGHLITFDGRRFDLPYLAARAMKHNMALKYRWPLGYNSTHVDLFELLGKEGKLDAWAMGLLGRAKTSHGSEIARMVEAGQWDEIKAHCLEDVQMTAELYDRLVRVASVAGR